MSDAASETAGGWTLLSEELLRGFVHAMNNRITSLGAVAELAELDDEPLDPSGVRSELARLVELARMVGSVALRGGPPEAMEARPLLDEALRLHAHHPRLRTLRCEVEQEQTPPPVRVPKWAFLRLLLLFIEQAKQSAAVDVKQIAVHLGGSAQALVVRAPSGAEPHPDADALAAVCGGSITTSDGMLTLELPSLAELRRREREAGAR